MALPAAIPAPPGYPSVEEAFALAPHHVDDSGWRAPFRADGLVPIGEGFALLVRGAKDDCHACAGRVDVIYFRRTNGGWKPYRRWNGVYEGGSWGDNFEIEPIQLGGRNPMLKLTDGYAQQGYVDDYISILELTPSRPILRVHEVQVLEANGAAGGGPDQYCHIEAAVAPLGGGRGLAVRYTGHRAHNAAVDATVPYWGRDERWRAHPRPFDMSCRADPDARAPEYSTTTTGAGGSSRRASGGQG